MQVFVARRTLTRSPLHLQFITRNMSANPTQIFRHDVVIVGGGMGGLYTAHQLLNKYGITDIAILESRRGVGGRLVTTHHEDESPKFNDFAWRIGETNTMMHQLAKDFNVELVEQFTPPSNGTVATQSWDTVPRADGKPPLSNFSAAALESTALAAPFLKPDEGVSSAPAPTGDPHNPGRPP